MATTSPVKLTIKLEGDESLKLALKAGFNENAMRSFTNRATLEAARALVKPMKAAAPVGNDGAPEARKVIKARRARKKGGGAIVGIKAGKGGVWYAKFVVKPTRPHTILAGKRFKFLSFGGGLYKGVQHPGTKGNPFVVESAEANLGLAREAFTKTVARLMTDEAFRKHVRGLRARFMR